MWRAARLLKNGAWQVLVLVGVGLFGAFAILFATGSSPRQDLP